MTDFPEPGRRLACTVGLLAVFTAFGISPALAEPDDDLARQLVNPVAALISVPFQLNYDQKIGTLEQGRRYTLNVQPVVPFAINDEWNVISRTIVPFMDQKNIFPGSGSQSGIGDTVQSLFFSPSKPTANGVIWGAGPAILLPTASNRLLGAEKWGLGPTAVALTQQGPWTYGALFNHIWSVGGNSDRAEVNTTFIQPFLAYVTATRTTFSVNTESTYDWRNRQWGVPINVAVSQLLKIGPPPLSIGLGGRYWADSGDTAQHGWAWRLTVTLLFPK